MSFSLSVRIPGTPHHRVPASFFGTVSILPLRSKPSFLQQRMCQGRGAEFQGSGRSGERERRRRLGSSAEQACEGKKNEWQGICNNDREPCSEGSENSPVPVGRQCRRQ